MIPYGDLEKQFTAPKRRVNHSRVPRKFKKKWKHVLQGNRYYFLTLDEKLWYIRWQTNPDYNRFLIKQITK